MFIFYFVQEATDNHTWTARGSSPYRGQPHPQLILKTHHQHETIADK